MKDTQGDIQNTGKSVQESGHKDESPYIDYALLDSELARIDKKKQVQHVKNLVEVVSMGGISFTLYFGAGWLLVTERWWLGLLVILLYLMSALKLYILVLLCALTGWLTQWVPLVSFVLSFLLFVASEFVGDVDKEIRSGEFARVYRWRHAVVALRVTPFIGAALGISASFLW